MKTLLITIIAMGMLSSAGFAQTNTFPSSGNVGIGTTSPGNSVSFQDVTNNSTAGITWYSPSPLNYGIYRTSGTWISPNYQQLNISWDTGISLSPGSSYGKSYVEINGGGLRVTSGNVGVGTTTPAHILTLSHGGVFAWKNAANNSETVGFGTGASDELIIYTGGVPHFTALANGNIGIGTTSPDELLTVNGNIHAKKVIVDLSIVPDYVFKPAYKLPSLDYVKNYVEKNSHLPEMPSEAEIKKNGLDLGEMNAILLKKMEEMTLYMLEKDKQVKTLQKQNKAIRRQQDLLEKQLEQLINAKK